MSKIKRKFFSYQLSDFQALQYDLELMAIKGWKLVKITNAHMIFHQVPSARIRYQIAFPPYGDMLDYRDNPRIDEYRDFCEESGWEYICNFNTLQIYATDDPSVVPLYTDDKTKLDIIHRCMKKNFIPPQILLLIVMLFNIGIKVYEYYTSPSSLLSSNSSLFLLLSFIIILGLQIHSLDRYFYWYRLSKYNISVGDPMPEGSSKPLSSYLLIASIPMILFIFSLSFTTPEIAILAFIMLFLFFGSFSLIHIVLKKLKRGPKINTAIILLTSIVIVASIPFLVVSTGTIRLLAPRPVETIKYDVKGLTYTLDIFKEDIPLKIEDFYPIITDYPYSYNKEESSSIFLTKGEYEQESVSFVMDSLYYEVLDVKWPIFYTAFVKEKIEMYNHTSERSWKVVTIPELTANKVYQLYSNDLPLRDEYILCYENQIIHVKFDFDDHQPNLLIVEEKLLKDS